MPKYSETKRKHVVEEREGRKEGRKEGGKEGRGERERITRKGTSNSAEGRKGQA
jgi:hypothetical protein